MCTPSKYGLTFSWLYALTYAVKHKSAKPSVRIACNIDTTHQVLARPMVEYTECLPYERNLYVRAQLRIVLSTTFVNPYNIYKIPCHSATRNNLIHCTHFHSLFFVTKT